MENPGPCRKKSPQSAAECATLMSVKTCIVTILVIGLFLAPGPSSASTVFQVTINGASNVPPLPVGATGLATLVLNDAQTKLSFNITYQGLTSPEIGAHIHNAGNRTNGPIVFALPAGTPKVGVWSIPAQYVTELFNNKLYINIHTETYAAGEIRGNIDNGVPAEQSTWGSIKALYSQ